MEARTTSLRVRHWLGLALFLLGSIVGAPGGHVHAQATQGPVFVLRIQGPIDLGLVPYLRRGIEQAAAERAQAVVLELDTPGGRLDAVLQMRDTLLAAPVRTIAFVNRTAFSAGALIALASNEIYMAPGAVLGAATPVDAAGVAADEKVISAVRKTFKATAELRERDPRVAEAMVDPEVAIEGLVGRGELLTLTTNEAQTWDYTDGIVASREELLRAAGLATAGVEEISPSPAEQVVRFLTQPPVASLLVALGVLLIMGDLFVGGIGAIGAAGLLLLALFFWGHFLAGLAGWEGVALVVLGLALVALEVLVVPGFGIPGILGGLALLAGLFISLVGGTVVTGEDLRRAAATVLGSLVLIAAGTLLLLKFLPRVAVLQGLVLQSQVGGPDAVPQRRPQRRRRTWLEGDRLEARRATDTGNGRTPRARRSLTGRRGVAWSDLRPGGFADIDGARVDVVTRGDYIAAGTPIEVIADEDYRRVVRRVEPDQEPPR